MNSPCVSFPSTQFYSVSLRQFYCIFVSCSFPPPCSNQKYKEANKFIKHSALKCLVIKASRRICAVILPSIITMPRTGNAYCREDNLCSDAKDGGLIAELSSMKCRRSAMPPMLHTRDAVQVEIVTMSVQCDLGRESLKFFMPRPSTPAPSTSSTLSNKNTGRTEAVAASGPPSTNSAPPPQDASQRPTSSPVAAPSPPPIASMEVDGDVAAPEVQAEEVNAAAATPKRRRHRQRKRKPAAPAAPLPLTLTPGK